MAAANRYEIHPSPEPGLSRSTRSAVHSLLATGGGRRSPRDLSDRDLLISAQNLVAAVFRLALADCRAEPLGPGASAIAKRLATRRRSEALTFLASRDAERLAEMVGIDPEALKWELARLELLPERPDSSTLAKEGL